MKFDSNFKDGGEKLEKFFNQYAKADSTFELLENRNEKMPEFLLVGKIMAEEFITDRDKYIDYILSAQLKNMQGEIQWEDQTVVKKYIKD